MRQPAVSHQLRVLKQAGLVRHRKEGRLAYYFLADDHVKKIVRQALTHVLER
jgi:ArsR family transcriptional regulator